MSENPSQSHTKNRKRMKFFSKNIRVIQENMIFVLGLPPILLDVNLLSRVEFFGQYGSIRKIKISPRERKYGRCVNITYANPREAGIAILCTNMLRLNEKCLRVSFGMSKICSHFLQQTYCCVKDCEYSHSIPECPELQLRMKNKQQRFQPVGELEVLVRLLKNGYQIPHSSNF